MTLSTINNRADATEGGQEKVSQERRKYYRLNNEVSISYEVVVQQEARRNQSILNVSLGISEQDIWPTGICIRVDRKIPTETKLSLELEMCQPSQTLRAFGTVDWCGISRKEGHFLAGIEVAFLKDGHPDESTQEIAKMLIAMFSFEIVIEDPEPVVVVIKNRWGLKIPVVAQPDEDIEAKEKGLLPISKLVK